MLPPDHIRDSQLASLLNLIRTTYGYDFTEYAIASMRRRVTHFMQTKKITAFEVLAEQLLHNEQLFEIFIQEVSVTVTEMFRDPAFFLSLRKNVIAHLATYPFIKIWIAGCATGEEVYSIAILLKEEGLLDRSLIYATDINQQSLQRAREGVYPAQQMKSFTQNYQKSGGKESLSVYYKAKYDAVMMDKSLAEGIVFSPHNLAVDKSFNEFQLIVCRNVLIYFNQQLQNKVINLFYESLCPLGFMGLGGKESILFSDKQQFFKDIDRKERIYRKMN